MLNNKILIVLIAMLSMPVVASQMATFKAPVSKEASNSDNSLYVISSQHTNRIVTPFKSPSIKLDNIEGVAYKKRGNVLYLSTTHNSNIAGWITEGGDESSAIRVVLKPMPVPPQEIILEGTHAQGSAIAKRFEQSTPRTEAIVNILSSIAVGTPPAGYQQKEVNAKYLPQCEQVGLSFDFFNGQFFSGGDYVVSIGVVTNTTNHSIEFKENLCYQDGVVGVALYPLHHQLPAQSKAEVLVMFHRNKVQRQKTMKRQSLLVKGE